MLFDQLIRLVVGLLELGLAAVLALGFFIGIVLLQTGFDRSGLSIMLGVTWFVISAIKRKR